LFQKKDITEPRPGMRWGSKLIVILTNFVGLWGQEDNKTLEVFGLKSGNIGSDVQNSSDIMLGAVQDKNEDDYEESTISEEDDNLYDYYGIDYDEEDENLGLGELLNDIGPELFQTVSPTLILGFFENASPEDLESVLGNTKILLKLPPKTIGTVLQKLPTELILQIVNSEGLKDLFLNSPEDPEEEKNLESFQADVATILFEKVDLAVITALPEYLIQSQLKNKKLLAELLKFPEKLFSVVGSFPQFLNDIPTSTFIDILKNNSTEISHIPVELIVQALEQVPEQIFSSLINRVMSEISPTLLFSFFENTSIAKLASAADRIGSESFSRVFSQIPGEVLASLVSSIPSELLLKLVSDPDLKNFLDPIIIETLTDLLSVDQLKLLLAHGILSEKDQAFLQKLPLTVLAKVAGNQELLSLISDETLLMVADMFPSLLEIVPDSSAANIVKTRPWLVGMLPLSLFTSFPHQKLENLLALLSDQDLSNLLTFQPALVNIADEMPTHLLVNFLQTRKSLLGKLPSVAEPFISQLLFDEKFIRKFPPSVLANLASVDGVEKFVTKYALISILKVHPSLPSLVPPSQFKPFLHFLSDPWFRTNIPCLTISLMSKEASLADIIPAAVMEKVITSRRILSCIPTTDLENLMEHRLRLSRLSMMSLLRSAKQLPTEKYSMGLVSKFLTHQAPQLGKALVNWELNWRGK